MIDYMSVPAGLAFSNAGKKLFKEQQALQKRIAQSQAYESAMDEFRAERESARQAALPSPLAMEDFGNGWNTHYPETMMNAPRETQLEFMEMAPMDARLRLQKTMNPRSRNSNDFAYSKGGLVRGPGTSISDSIPARLSRDEYVLPKESVDLVGLQTLEALRQAGLRQRGEIPQQHALRDASGTLKLASGLPWTEYVNQQRLTPEQLRILRSGIDSAAQAAGRSPELEVARRLAPPSAASPTPTPVTENLAAGRPAQTLQPYDIRSEPQLRRISGARPNPPMNPMNLDFRANPQFRSLTDPGYRPVQQGLLGTATSLGGRTAGGLGMLLYPSELGNSDLSGPEGQRLIAKNLAERGMPISNGPGAPNNGPGTTPHAKPSQQPNFYAEYTDEKLKDTIGNAQRLLGQTGGSLNEGTANVMAYRSMLDEAEKRGIRPVFPPRRLAVEGTTQPPAQQIIAQQAQPQLPNPIESAFAHALDLALNGQYAKNYQGTRVFDSEGLNQKEARQIGTNALTALAPYYQEMMAKNRDEAARKTPQIEQQQMMLDLMKGVARGDKRAQEIYRQLNQPDNKQSVQFSTAKLPNPADKLGGSIEISGFADPNRQTFTPVTLGQTANTGDIAKYAQELHSMKKKNDQRFRPLLEQFSAYFPEAAALYPELYH